MEINKDTVLCISLASRPSNFGTTVHNAAYRALGLNFVYKAFGISELKGALSGVRSLGIRGCSVSMPFKQEVIKELDELDEIASSIGAVNAVVNDSGRLVGYNTDTYGAEMALRLVPITPADRVLLLGAGGVASAILYALRHLGIKNIYLANRTESKAKQLAGSSIQVVAWKSRHDTSADLIINATSIGMGLDADQTPIDLGRTQGCRAVMDVIVSPVETSLMRKAREMQISAVPGYKMSLYQAEAQFKLYTGLDAPLEAMERSALRLLQISEGTQSV